MAGSLSQDFQDIGYEEYDEEGDIPFTIDADSMGLNRRDSTVMPIKPRVSVAGSNKLVVKRIWSPTDKDMDDRMKRGILKEAKCLQNASHRHVVGFITAYYSSDDSCMGIVMERADGDINKYLECKKTPSQTSKICDWFRCLANVVRYVHGRGITHRDIKPPNILVKDGKVLLADFGISKMGLEKTIATTDVGKPRARTPQYAAPEVEDGYTRGRSADVFSLGAVFLEMLVAHSYPQERQRLVEAKTSSSGQSYAKTIKNVQSWMSDLERKIGIEQKWQQMVLRLCKDMMKEDRDQRPKIEDVYDIILSEEPPSEPFGSCCKRMVEDRDLTDDKKLIEACQYGNQVEVDKLLGRGVSSNIVGAIHLASANGFEGIVKTLLKHGASINLRDYSDQTALHCAAGRGQESVVETLLEYGAKVGPQDAEGRTPLHYASAYGNPNIVGKLLAHKVNFNIQDENKQTALHLAAKGKQKEGTGHEEVFRMLLKCEADVSIMDLKGKTALDYAKR